MRSGSNTSTDCFITAVPGRDAGSSVVSVMKIVIFGLSVSSAWGNGHATIWRGLIRELHRAGHNVVFFEKDVPYYASHRDLHELPGGGELRLYSDWSDVAAQARRQLADADVGMVTSYCPDAQAASDAVLGSSVGLRTYYDLDTPVTLERMAAGHIVEYIPNGGLREFDLVLSYTGGRALDLLRERLGARETVPIYGSVDPETHFPVGSQPEYNALMSYLGTYAADRQPALEALLVRSARQLPEQPFLLGGPLYPADFVPPENVRLIPHVPPAAHPAFYCSSRWTLNLTRKAMADYGFCPSGRLFEAAACGVPMLSDAWEGLDRFFEPQREIQLVRSTEDVLQVLQLTDAERLRIARAARERVMSEHTAARRAEQMINAFTRRAAQRQETR
jgi:spore maturation protein CgeB